ncbi:ATP-grasp domain-containing protein [Lysinibacillus yapensis]|uniref:ATP-grasp domain-containing protein n=1 Tax=Ureibacillus yapensis TaxID=2304605 RepID=A0A396S9X3_9BACL|nr:ATP-grasp domain-containing protein [Lysinibacillus yapensis]RHW37581.1 ATP-grasp domain-containing protein [Lysinibacillus yapensis]
MPSIIFLETYKSGSSREGLSAAKSLGYKVHLLTSNLKILKGKEDFLDVDEFHLVNVKDIDLVKKTVLEIQLKDHVAGIISFIDSYVFLAASLSNELCGTPLSLNAYKKMEDKILTRKQLLDDRSNPFFFILTKDTILKDFIHQVKHKLPLVVKLPSSCGSKNVYLVKTVAELRNRLLFLRYHFDEDLLIEEFLRGPQCIVEVIAQNGNYSISALVEQEITHKERFIVTGYSISNEVDHALENSLIAKANEVLQRLEFVQGNCHLEFRFADGNWKLIEANPRMSGGVMNELIKEAYGFNYAEQILHLYLGNSPTLNKTKEENVYAHYLTVSQPGKLVKVTGVQNVLQQSGVIKVYIKPVRGDILLPPLSMGNRCGYILAKGKTKAEAKNNAIKAAAQIKFHLIPL